MRHPGKYVDGGVYYFCALLQERGSDLLVREIDLLRWSVGMTLREFPVAEVRAFVVLPDRMHAIWKMPEGECAFPRRWSSIKGRFTRGLRETGRASREEHIWGKRVWAHALRDEADFAAHMQICWQAPVVAGLVSRAEDWPFSSFAREAALGGRQAVG